MKFFLSILAAIYSIAFYSQSFTNGSVFNYAVNDTLVTDYIQYPGGWMPPNSPPVRTYRALNKNIIPPIKILFFTR